jgi:outer membrane protein TolC
MARRISILSLLACLLLAVHGRDAYAQVLRFEEILQESIRHSYDLKISGLEVEIGRQRLNEARAMFFPELSLRLTNEYLADLNKDGAGTVAVGDTIISGNESAYQHSLSLYADYLLYDFGARLLKYQNAERDLQVAVFLSDQSLIDFKDKVLEIYGRGLILYKRMEVWKVLLDQRKEIFGLTERLHQAGDVGKTELGNAAIAVAEAVQTLESLGLEFASALQDLSYLTGKSYRSSSVEFSQFPDTAPPAEQMDVHNLPEIKAYEVKIEQKKTEYEIARREWLPSLTLYSSYRMYGQDPSSITESLGDIKQQNATVGIIVDVNLFNGFRDRAKVERLQRELSKLQVEREKKIAGVQRLIATLAEKTRIYEGGMEDWRSLHLLVDEQKNMNDRLTRQQVIDRVSFLLQQGDLLGKVLALEIRQVERALANLQLQILMAS